MGLRGFLILGLCALLAFAAAMLATDVARPIDAVLELGRGRPTRVDAEEARFLAEYPEDVTLTYYVGAPDALPSPMRQMERRVRAVLDNLASASAGRIEVRVLRPDADPAIERFAASRNAAPFRRRSVVADRFSEATVWSSLEIAAGANPPVLLRALGPEHLPHLRALILTHLRSILEPPRPRVAFAAPPGFSAFEALLAQVADVERIDLDGGARPSADADLVVWLEPRNTDPRLLADLEAFRQDGGSLLIAGSEFRAEVGTNAAGQPELRLAERGLDARVLWSNFGLETLGRVVLDERSQRVVLGESEFDLPFLVRSIGHNQDFRGFVDQPAGSLLFAAPTAFALNGEALAQRRLGARVLATSSDRTTTRDLAIGPPGSPIAVPLADVAVEAPGTRPLAKQPLAVFVEPDDTWQGALLALGSASALHDGSFDDPLFAHNRFAQIVAIELLSNARLVARRTDLQRPERLPALGNAQRIALRLAVLLALPGLLLAVGFARRDGRPRDGVRTGLRRVGTSLAGLVVLLLCGAGLAALGKTIGLWADLSAGGVNRVSATTLALARELETNGPVELTWYGSALARLAPEQRAGARRALALFEQFAGEAGGAASFERIDPASLAEEARAELETTGITPFQVRTEDGERTEVRAVHATLRIRHGSRTEDLLFPDGLAFEDAEFRLAHALWRLREGRSAVIALATDSPRLSPAEAQTEFLARQRFAPSGTDVYSLARAALERADFRVVHVAPQTGALPENADALVWLQPRRSIGRMLDAAVHHLAGGGRALIAAQHFAIQPQQHEGSDFESVYWPQPQVPDLETTYLPELGVELVREVLFDEFSADVPLVTRIGSDPVQKAYDVQTSALPFLLRIGTSQHTVDPVTAGIGDQVLPFGNAIRLDEGRLAARGLVATPLMRTSPRTWSFPWRGGYLPPELLLGPPADDSGAPDFAGEKFVAVRVTGQFPLPVEPLFTAVEGEAVRVAPKLHPGELLLIGGSELFKNERILDPRFRADRLLVNAAAHLALPAPIAELAGRRAVPPSLAPVADERRVLWRILVIAGGPAVAFAAFVLRRVATARTTRAIPPAAARSTAGVRP